MNSETTKIYLTDLLLQAFNNLGFNTEGLSLKITVPEQEFGDYAANAALVLAKKLKLDPQEVAGQVVAEFVKLDEAKVFQEAYQAKGFVNFRLSPKSLVENVYRILNEKDNFGKSKLGENKTVVVEYFQNNVAKPPHVGHLRSAVVGDSLLRIFRFLGFHAMSDTHIGDWGTQFGILILGYKTFGNKTTVEKDPIFELNKIYVEMSSRIEQNPELREQAKQEFAKLEKGDAENRKLWQWFVMESVVDFEHYRRLLELLSFDHNLGESFYEDKMPAVMEALRAKRLALRGETGEEYVDLEQYGLGRCILVKSDGATTYHLRDFATYIFRKGQFDFYKNIYVVDNRQAHHFKQLFKVLELMGYPAERDSVHVDLGFMSLPEGPISTRKGNIISLQNLVDEAEKRAIKIIEEKNPGLANKSAVAKMVALAAIKYFDLSHNRKTEFTFTWENALSFEGNTGPYLQYSHARIHGILKKFQITNSKLQINLQTNLKSEILNLKSEELSVLRKLYQFPLVLEQAAQDYLPNLLCNYLFELSQNFNAFYQEVPVLQEKDSQLKLFRLNLITATAQVIKNGLYLLGIEAPEEM
ncbi:MAG: arginine--tRNA ligase [Patescibacteria group bacterium]|nr:arginine--tRNA ligase [Patescibacteria group bacterium]